MVAATTPESIADAAALLAVVADPVRLFLVRHLADVGTRCVCELQPDPPIPANLLSYHLRVLREADLVDSTKVGRRVHYALTPGALDRLHEALPRVPAWSDR